MKIKNTLVGRNEYLEASIRHEGKLVGFISGDETYCEFVESDAVAVSLIYPKKGWTPEGEPCVRSLEPFKALEVAASAEIMGAEVVFLKRARASGRWIPHDPVF